MLAGLHRFILIVLLLSWARSDCPRGLLEDKSIGRKERNKDLGTTNQPPQCRRGLLESREACN